MKKYGLANSFIQGEVQIDFVRVLYCLAEGTREPYFLQTILSFVKH